MTGRDPRSTLAVVLLLICSFTFIPALIAGSGAVGLDVLGIKVTGGTSWLVVFILSGVLLIRTIDRIADERRKVQERALRAIAAARAEQERRRLEAEAMARAEAEARRRRGRFAVAAVLLILAVAAGAALLLDVRP